MDTPRVAIAVPAVDWMWTASVQALFSVLLTPPQPRLMMPTKGCTIARKRNDCVKHFLELDCTHLLFIDSDMTPPANVVARLAAHDRDVVAALYFARHRPHPPMAGSGTLSRPGQYLAEWDMSRPLTKVDWVGTGCVLIKRRVFEKLKAPWFEANQEDYGEDINFCEKARGKGFGIFVDVATVAGHVGAQAVDLEYLTTPRLDVRRA